MKREGPALFFALVYPTVLYVQVIVVVPDRAPVEPHVAAVAVAVPAVSAAIAASPAVAMRRLAPLSSCVRPISPTARTKARPPNPNTPAHLIP